MSLVVLKAELKIVDDQIVEKKLNLTANRNQITEDFKAHIKTDYKNLAEKVVIENPENTKKLEPGKLSEFKQKLLELYNSIDAAVDNEFANDKIWKYNSSEKEMEEMSRDISTTGEYFFNHGIQIAYEQIYYSLGRLLCEYEYLGKGYNADWSSPNCERTIDYYPKNLSKGSAIERSLRSFRRDLIELANVFDKRKELIENIHRQEASDLWNNA